MLGVVLFYDGPKPPAGLYDHFLDLPNSGKAIIEGSFLDFVSSIPPPVRDRCIHLSRFSCKLLLTHRLKSAYFDGVPFLHYSEPVLKATTDNLQVSNSGASPRAPFISGSLISLRRTVVLG